MNSQLINLAKNLILIESTGDRPEELEKVLDLAKNSINGFNYEEFVSNGKKSLLVYNSKKRPKRFKIILNAHLDIVKANKAQYKSVIRGNKLYARGSYDMKAAAAAEILAFKEVAAKVNYPLGLQLVTDEESGGFDGTSYQIQKGVRADFAIVGEPTRMNIRHQSKGCYWYELTTTGKSSHAAYLWEGDNAIDKMNKVLDRVKQKYPTPKKTVWSTTVNVSKVSTNNATFNSVPDNCTAVLDIRFIPREKVEVIKDLEKIVGKDAKLKNLIKVDCYSTPKDNEYLKKLLDAFKSTTGKKAVLEAAHGGCDIRYFDAVGCKGIEFSPYGDAHHTDHEWVDLKSLQQYYEILKEFLLHAV